MNGEKVQMQCEKIVQRLCNFLDAFINRIKYKVLV